MPVSFAPETAHYRQCVTTDSVAPRHGDRRVDTILHAWYDWCNQGNEGEQRGVALARIRQCILSKADTIDLAGLNLGDLPPCWPPHLKCIDLAHNRLTAWPSKLPAGMSRISLAYNRLSDLPEDLGAGLQYLDMADNLLTTLPEVLPHTLVELELKRNRLTQLPAFLPDDMAYLGLSDNCLTALPEVLPGLLLEFDVVRNRLASLPALLPPFLSVLRARENTLTALPADLPPLLMLLDLGGNRLTDYPIAAMRLGAHCLLHLDGNCFSADVRNQIVNAVGAVGALGPVVSGVTATETKPDAAWRNIIPFWYCDTHNENNGAAPYWNAVAREHGASAFFEFLHRLSFTFAARVPEFKSFVGQWLIELLDQPDLRRITFAVAHESTSSCDDRVTLALNDMLRVRVLHDVENGFYDTQIPALIACARSMFRQECLELIAREKIADLTFSLRLAGCTEPHKAIDEVCLFLAYQVKLRQALQLWTPISKMQFFNVAKVGRSDLVAAEAAVKMRENDGFSLWLTRWAPWTSVLQRLSPMYGAIQRTLENYMDTSLQKDVAARLERAAIPVDDVDAAAVVGRYLADEATDAARLGMTRSLLAVCRGENLLDPVWPPYDPAKAENAVFAGSPAAPATVPARTMARFVLTRPRSHLHAPTAHLAGQSDLNRSRQPSFLSSLRAPPP